MPLPIGEHDVGDEIGKLIQKVSLDTLTSKMIRTHLTQTFKVIFGKEHKEEVDRITKAKIEELTGKKAKSKTPPEMANSNSHAQSKSGESRRKEDSRRSEGNTPDTSQDTEASRAGEEEEHREKTPEPVESENYVTEKAVEKTGIRFLYCVVQLNPPVDSLYPYYVVPHQLISGRMNVGRPIKLKMPTWDEPYSCKIIKLCENEHDANKKMGEFVAKNKEKSIERSSRSKTATPVPPDPEGSFKKPEEPSEVVPEPSNAPEEPLKRPESVSSSVRSLPTPEPMLESTPIKRLPTPRRDESPSPNGLVIDEESESPEKPSPKAPEISPKALESTETPQKGQKPSILSTDSETEASKVPKSSVPSEKSPQNRKMTPEKGEKPVQKSSQTSESPLKPKKFYGPSSRRPKNTRISSSSSESDDEKSKKSSKSSKMSQKSSRSKIIFSDSEVSDGPTSSVPQKTPQGRERSREKFVDSKISTQSSSNASRMAENLMRGKPPSANLGKSKKPKPSYVSSYDSDDSYDEEASRISKNSRRSVDSKMSKKTEKKVEKKPEKKTKKSKGQDKEYWAKVIKEMPKYWVEIEPMDMSKIENKKYVNVERIDSDSDSEKEVVPSKSIKKVKPFKDLFKKSTGSPFKNPAKKSISGPPRPPGFKSIREERDEKLRAMRESKERSQTPSVSSTPVPPSRKDQATPQPPENGSASTSDLSTSLSSLDTSKGPSTHLSSKLDVPKEGVAAAGTPTGVRKNPAKKTITQPPKITPAAPKIVEEPEKSPETKKDDDASKIIDLDSSLDQEPSEAAEKEAPGSAVINFLKDDNIAETTITELWDEFSTVIADQETDENRVETRKEREPPKTVPKSSSSPYVPSIIDKPREKTERDLMIEKLAYERISGSSSTPDVSKKKDKDKAKKEELKKRKASQLSSDVSLFDEAINVKKAKIDESGPKTPKEIVEGDKKKEKKKIIREEKKKVETRLNIDPGLTLLSSLFSDAVAGSSSGLSNGISPTIPSTLPPDQKTFFDNLVQVLQNFDDRQQKRHEESMAMMRRLQDSIENMKKNQDSD